MSLRGLLLTLLASVCLFAFAISMYNQTMLSSAAFAFAIVLAVLLFTWSWCYFRDYKEPVVIDADGVRIGDESWRWDCLKAVRVFPGPKGYEILIWPNRDRGVGRALPIDHPLDAEAVEDLLSRLRAFVSELALSCELGQYSR